MTSNNLTENEKLIGGNVFSGGGGDKTEMPEYRNSEFFKSLSSRRSKIEQFPERGWRILAFCF
jgi:hypothetical protein